MADERVPYDAQFPMGWPTGPTVEVTRPMIELIDDLYEPHDSRYCAICRPAKPGSAERERTTWQRWADEPLMWEWDEGPECIPGVDNPAPECSPEAVSRNTTSEAGR